MIISKTSLLCWKTIVENGPFLTDEELDDAIAMEAK